MRSGLHLVLLGYETDETYHASPLGKTDCDRVQRLLPEFPRRLFTHVAVEGACTGTHDLDTNARTHYGGRIWHPRTPSKHECILHLIH